MKSIWKGFIGFGLVNIPVKLYSAVHESDLDLDLLDKRDLSNIRYKRVNENTGREVRWEDMVRGYKLNERYVVLTDKDMEQAAAEKSKRIEIEDFVKLDGIDTLYYEMPYYLEPEKSGHHAYALLREAMKKSGRAGIARFVLRNKEHLAVLKPSGKMIVLNRIRFEQEIRNEKELALPAMEKIQPREMKMALSLIEQFSASFNSAKYKDTYAGELLKLIKMKSKGRKIAAPEMKVAYRAGDLMSQLKASLSNRKKHAS